MSCEDATKLLGIVRGADNEKKVDQFTVLKTRFKKERVDEDCIGTFTEAFKFGLQCSNAQALCACLQCLNHFLKRLNFQPDTELPKPSHASLAHAIASKLGDKDKIADAALGCLLELWKLATQPVEYEIKEAGFQSRQWKCRIRAIQWLQKIYSSRPNFALRTYTTYLISCLEDPSEIVREACMACVVDIFTNASSSARTDLKTQMQKQNVRKAIYNSVMQAIEPASAATTNSQRPTHSRQTSRSRDEEVISEKQPRGGAGSIGGSAAGSVTSTHVASIAGSELESLEPLDVSSARDLENQISAMMPPFQGRETEQNWGQREKAVLTLRRLLRGNVMRQHEQLFMDCVKTLLDGILKAFNSLRTTLSSQACQLIKDLAIMAGPMIDFAADTFLSNVIKMTATTKKITANMSHMTVAVLLERVSFHPRLVQHIWHAAQDKNVQPRQFAPVWISVLLEAHNDSSGYMESSSAIETIEKCLLKLLSDANVTVRERARDSFWVFQLFWPAHAESLKTRMDSGVRKQLEKSSMKGPSSANSGKTITSGQPRSHSRAGSRDLGNTLQKKEEQVHPKLGLSSGAMRRGLGLPQRPPSAADRPISKEWKRPQSPAQSSRGQPPSPLSNGRMTSPASANRTMRPAPTVKRMGVIEQLTHEDWNVRADGVITIACMLARKRPPGFEGQKPPPMPSSETLSPVLQKIVNDPKLDVVVHLFAPEVFGEIVKILPIECMVPKLLLLSEGDPGAEGEKVNSSLHVAQECLPIAKSMLTDEEAASILFKILMTVSASGVVPRKMVDSTFTTPQKRKIMHGLLLWLDEVVARHVEAISENSPGNPYFADTSNYKLYVNRIVPLVTKTKTESQNFAPMATLLKRLESIDKPTFDKVLMTFERETVRRLKMAWGVNFEEDTIMLEMEEPVATVDQVLGETPKIDRTFAQTSVLRETDVNSPPGQYSQPSQETTPVKSDRPARSVNSHENRASLDGSDKDHSFMEDHENMTMIPAAFANLKMEADINNSVNEAQRLQPYRAPPKAPKPQSTTTNDTSENQTPREKVDLKQKAETTESSALEQTVTQTNGLHLSPDKVIDHGSGSQTNIAEPFEQTIDDRLRSLSKEGSDKIRIFGAMLEKLEDGVADAYCFRKLSRIVRDEPPVSTLGSETRDELLWHYFSHERLVNADLQYLIKYGGQQEVEESCLQALLLLQHLTASDMSHLTNQVPAILETLFDLRSKSTKRPFLSATIDEATCDIVDKVDPSERIGYVAKYLEPYCSGESQALSKPSIVLAIESAGRIARRLNKQEALSTLPQYVQIITKAIDDKDAEIRRASVTLCVAYNAALGDTNIMFDTLKDLPTAKKNLLAYYFSKDHI